MSDHRERACWRCGSLLHHEDDGRCEARHYVSELEEVRGKLAAESRARAEAEAREAVMREVLQSASSRSASSGMCGWCHGHCADHRTGCFITRRETALATPSPVATALVELERAAREYRDAYDRFDEDESNTSLDALNAAEKVLIAAVTNLDRARGGR